MTVIQFDLFKSKEDSEIDSLKEELERVKISGDKVRKGTYAKLNELNKECLELKFRLDIIEKNICSHGRGI